MEKQLYRGGQTLYSGGEPLYSGGEPLYSGGELLYQKQQAEERPVVLAKYNDPKQINTVLDLIFNTAALETRYKSAGLGARFKAMQDMLMEQYVNPVIAGEWGVVGLNTLFSFSESVDVFGNVVKSITAPLVNTNPELAKVYKDLTLTDRIKSSIGIGEHGRINYDYATGNLFTDIVLEVVSDPATWLTMGSSMLAKSAAKSAKTAAEATVKQADDLLMATATDEASSAAVKSAMEVFAKEVGNRDVVKAATQMLNARKAAAMSTSEHADFIKTFLNGAVKVEGKEDTLEVKTLAEALTLSLKAKGLLKDVDAITARQMSDLFERSLNTAVDRTTIQTLKTMDTVVNVTDKIQTVLMQAALSPCGITPVYKIITKGFPSIGRWITAQFTNANAAFVNDLGDYTPMDMFKVLPVELQVTGKIKDALSNDHGIFVDFLEPSSTYKYHRIINKDVVFFEDMMQTYGENPEAAIKTMRTYLNAAHRGATLDEYILQLEAIQAYLKSVDATDVVVDRHLTYIKQLKERLFLSEEKLAIKKNLEQLGKMNDTLEKAKFALLENTGSTGFIGIVTKAFKDYSGIPEELFEELNPVLTRIYMELDEIVSEIHFGAESQVTLQLDNALADVRLILDDILDVPAKLNLAEDVDAVDALLDVQPYRVRFSAAINAFNKAVTEYDTNHAGILYELEQLNESAIGALRKATEASQAPASKVLKFLEKLKVVSPKNDPSIKVVYGSKGIKPLDMFAALDVKREIMRVLKRGVKDVKLSDAFEMSIPEEVIEYVHPWHFESIETWLNTPITNLGYVDAWYDATRTQQSIKDRISSEAEESAVNDLLQSIDTFEGLVDKFKPSDVVLQSSMIDANEHYIVTKYEQLYNYISLVSNSNLQTVMTELKTGNLRQYLDSTEDEGAERVLQIVEGYYATKGMVQAIANSSLTEGAKMSVLASIQKQNHNKADYIIADFDKFIEELTDASQTFYQQTYQASRRLSLDYVRSTNVEDYGKFRESLGLSKEYLAHDAGDDNITSYYVFRKQVEDGYKPAKEIFESNKRIVLLDTETQNILTNSGNTAHQTALTTIEGNTIKNTSVRGVNADYIKNGLLPDVGYLRKLEMTEEEYLRHYAGKEADEKALIFKLYQDLYDSIKNTFNPVTGQYDAVLITHNGEGFDLKLLAAKVRQYDLGNELKKVGIDPHLLENCNTYDTFKHSKIQNSYFELSAEEIETVKDILLPYVEDMNLYGCKQLFSAPSSSDLRTIMAYFNDMLKSKTTKKPGTKKTLQNDPINEEIAGLLQKLRASFDSFEEIKESNKAFRRDLIPASMLTNRVIDGKETMAPENKAMILAFFKDMMGEEKATKLFGDGSNITPTMVYGALQEYQSIAYKNFYKADLVQNFFVASTEKLTRLEALTRMSVAKVLTRYASKVQYAQLYVADMPEMLRVIDLLKREKQFAYLSDLRTTNLNVQQTYAVFKYLVKRYNDKTALPELIGDEMLGLANIGHDLKDWLGPNKFAKHFEEGTYYNATQKYMAQIESVKSLDNSINEFTQYLDKDGLADASIQLNHMVCSSTVAMLEKLTNICRSGRNAMRGITGRMSDFTKHVKRKAVASFVHLDAEQTIDWLAHSKGFVYINKESALDYRAFLKKLAGEDFIAKNIAFADTREGIWVWLTKEANWHAMIQEGQVIHYVNGVAYEPKVWAGINKQDIRDISSNFGELTPAVDDFVDSFQEAYERLMYITEYEAGHSALEELNQTQLFEGLVHMPQAMRDTFYDEVHLTQRQLWQGAQYNHSYLGPSCKVVNLYSSDIASNLAKTMQNQVQKRTAAARYTTAIMDSNAGIAKSYIAEMYKDKPKEVLAYFKAHPEVCLVVPYKSDKSKLGYRVEEVIIHRQEDLQYAIDNNARFMTSTVYNKLYEVLNDNIYSDTLIGHWQALLRQFKIGYMLNPGTWARNSLDAFIKNMFRSRSTPMEVADATVGAAQGIRAYEQIIKGLYEINENKHLPDHEIIKTLIVAANDHNTYQDIAEQLYRLNKFQPLEDMQVDAIKAFLVGYKGMTYERFMQIHIFSMTAAAGGEAGVYSKMSKQQANNYVEDLLATGGMNSAEAQKIKRIRSYEHLTSLGLTPMNYVERVSRLAEFDLLTRKGYNTSQANHIVESTHFSYDTKSPIEQTLELIIPFYTFISRNFDLWTDAVEFNPGYLSIMRDVLEPTWDLGQYDSDELQENDSLQRQVLMGNIPISGTDYFLSTSFSFMDALEWVSQPIPNAYSSMFSPISTVIGVAMQKAADRSYAEGSYALSNWLQGTFGADRSLAQLEDKYGSWTNTYRLLYGDLSERRTTQEHLSKIAYAINLIPLVGSLLSRLYKTGVFYDDEPMIGRLGYMLGLTTKASRWQDFADKDNKGATAMHSYSMQIYNLLQAGGENVWAYTRLKNALGYQDVSLGNLPEDVKVLILQAMTGSPITVDVIPVLKDADTMRLLWESALRKHNAPQNLDEAPQELLQEIYFDIAKSAVHLSSIMDMLQNDETTRYSYAVAKSELGLKDIKLSQLPNEALEVIEHAMKVRYYGTGPSTGNRAAGAPSRRRGYPRKGYHQMSYVKGSGTGLYDTRKGVYPNYGHRSAQKVRIYDKHYTKTGKSRMELRMMPITPVNLSYRRKDMFYYYK